jgi:transcriptional regulator with XRE-family HTH domain
MRTGQTRVGPVHEEFDLRQSDAVAAKVREELARRRLSRQWLADEARISISTLEKALSGRRPFTLGTVVRIEEALTKKLRDAPAQPSELNGNGGLAPEELGAYARPAVRWLEGHYLTLRPSLNEPEAIYAYRTSIEWDEAECLLRFREAARIDSDFTQQGVVSFPHLSGHIYLVTNESGQYRLVLLGRPTIHGAMNGVLTTLAVGTGSQLIPAATPITLVPCKGPEEPELGLIRPGMPCYEEYRERVDRIAARGFALFPC